MRLSMRRAIVLDMTVLVDDDSINAGCLTTPQRRAASTVSISKASTASSSMRVLQRVRLRGPMGASVFKYTSLKKYCQYGVSARRKRAQTSRPQRCVAMIRRPFHLRRRSERLNHTLPHSYS